MSPNRDLLNPDPAGVHRGRGRALHLNAPETLGGMRRRLPELEKAINRAAMEVARADYRLRKAQLSYLVTRRLAGGEDPAATGRWLNEIAHGTVQLDSPHQQERE